MCSCETGLCYSVDCTPDYNNYRHQLSSLQAFDDHLRESGGGGSSLARTDRWHCV